MPRNAKTQPQRETELYAPIRDYLVAQGYTVRGEVRSCDLVAQRGEELIVVELKRQFSLDLLLQAIQRQKLTEAVYVAVPRPARLDRKWRGFHGLLRRLELGLIFITFGRSAPRVEIVFHPIPFAKRRDAKQRRVVLREIAGRSQDVNPGGSTRRKLITAYRESALRIAVLLEQTGAVSPKALRAQGAPDNTRNILYDNVYGWFTRVDRALYDLSPAGRTALEEYADLAARFREDAIAEEQ